MSVDMRYIGWMGDEGEVGLGVGWDVGIGVGMVDWGRGGEEEQLRAR